MENLNPEITAPMPAIKEKASVTKPSKTEKKTEPDNRKPFVLKPKKPTSPWIFFNNEKVAALKKEKSID
jgi:hypothetical protein